MILFFRGGSRRKARPPQPPRRKFCERNALLCTSNRASRPARGRSGTPPDRSKSARRPSCQGPIGGKADKNRSKRCAVL